ncbi:MAG TPA: hypothetical protein VM115_15500 [Vicinamibacterales bacterium]|nr:hypothetical protein [Vicinamibacterales bacterium]
MSEITDFDAAIAASRSAFLGFTARCQSAGPEYRLTPAADLSPYARCFGVFCRTLALEPFPSAANAALAVAIRADVRTIRSRIDPRGKPFRQLLAFSLSSLSALGALAADPLEDLVDEQIPDDVKGDLDRYGALGGVAGSGNQAMFTAIFLLHARDHLERDTDDRLQQWVTLHIRHMNRFGFWGHDAGMTHLQFQNGYHQYEIFEYLQVSNPRMHESVAAVRSLVDPYGHFAPYPGGGGCYDYDAVFLLTPYGALLDDQTRHCLQLTANTLLGEQRSDGGFAESLSVRPRNVDSFTRLVGHIARSRGNARLFVERLRYGLAVQRPKHDRIQTHWSEYSRRWDESDLWDAWFRMMTVARIQIAFNPEKASAWGFIDYPGIGHHPRMRPGAPSPR